jgi:very-short-patch-repair endonuclease
MGRHLPQLARCRNDFEIDFVLLCEERGLPIPEPNVRKGHYVPDMTWESRRLIVELDGKGAHTSAAQIAYDAKRQEWLEALGYTVIRFTWAEVYFRQDFVVGRLLPHLRS